LITTYGIVAHSTRTSTMDMDGFEETRDQMPLDNKPFVPQAGIKYAGKLTRNAPARAASSVVIGCSKLEDTNSITARGPYLAG
jgi:hypothetical protein